jgi:adenosylhomocysteinase
VLGAEQLRKVKPGAVLFNAGHSNREIDIDWLYRQPHKQLRPQIELFEPGKTHLYLLGRGSLLNLSAGTGPYGLDQFDHYDAVMLRGISWMLDGMPETIQPGLQRFPLQLEQEIASLSLRISTKKG